MKKPSNLLIYYGWLNSFNSAQNSWTNEKVAQDLARYGLLVFGDGVQTPSHGDYANTQIIIARIKVLNPAVKIFGYVSTYQSYEDFTAKVEDWNDLAVHGIFMDEGGYDYGTVGTNGRAAFNSKVDYIHSLSNANTCFVNAWKLCHILGTNNDVSFPDSTWNPDVLDSNLHTTDWALMESFAITSVPAYEGKALWASRGALAREAVSSIQLAACSVIDDTDVGGQDKFDFIYVSACMWGLGAVGSSDAYYGASSAKSKMWTRPDVEKVGCLYGCEPVIVVDNGDSDVYMRYLEYGLMKLDFSTGAEDSYIGIY